MSARAGLVVALAAASVLWAAAARAAELVMFELAGCPWCVKWHRDIGTLYGNTEEGALLPLRRVALTSPPGELAPGELAAVKDVTVAPTFVVLDCGVEQGRIIGFNGEDQFWGDLAAIVARMKTEGRPKARC